MKDEALKLAAEFDKRFTSMNGVDVPEKISVPRDEWRALHSAIKQAREAPEEKYVYGTPLLDAMTKDYEPVWNNLPSNKDVEDALRMKRLNQLTTPPAQRTWVGLTHDEFKQIMLATYNIDLNVPGHSSDDYLLWNAIEAKLKEKNT